MLEDNTSTSPSARRSRRGILPAVLIGALFVATAIGGFAGGTALRYWTGERQAPAVATAIASPAPAAQNLALNVTEGSPAAVFKAVAPAVVTIVVNGQRATGPFSQPTQGEGSGFIVDEQGDILTNNHVIEGARTIEVIMADGTRLTGKVVGSDPGSDLAVVNAAIPRDKLALAKLGDSDRLSVGDPVVAIGTPFGLDQTMTSGIVSALKRTFGEAGGRPMRNLIQTDAPINPGNSGGPLLNLQGEVIGITTSIESPVRASVGIGFAIPSNAALNLLPALKQGTSIEHAWLGISGQAINAQLAQQHQLPVNKGVWVIDAVVGGPAAKAGILGGDNTRGASAILKGGDIITTVDERAVAAIEDIAGYIDTRRVGDSVTVGILRDGKAMQITVKLESWPKSSRS